ncbi:MAG: WYL domain-containing protein, partial [Anaerolineaceae bacterium]
SALLKLTSALPAAHRKEEERIRGRIHLDWDGWSGLRQPTPYLNVVYQALFTDRQVLIRFPMHFGAIGEKTIHPLGLVTKAGVWHLVCLQNGLVKVHRISDLLYAEIRPEPAARPEGFRLESFWQEYCGWLADNRSYYAVTVRLPADQLADLERVTEQHAERLRQQPDHLEETSLIDVKLVFYSLAHARSRLLVFGGALEVMEPRALRLSMADYAEQILRKYRPAQVV